ncbi:MULTISPECIES: ABC transporter substrate-binding protein [Brevibacterium]|jgi:putative ABC transport system substrate-binding protein|uniref:ABC transporter substrate-binding protein n=1 Tax=Brevibacterium salitolerans TaxID=1403566 RepID=A0ABN2WE47_9MICO|nr:ABC transporter substrate-binding protein [Brevibacterium sp.]
MRTPTPGRLTALSAAAAASVLVLSACGDGGGSSGGEGESYSIGISQLVQHPALDASAEGFKEAFADAGYTEGENVEFDLQNANGEQATAVSIAQSFATDGHDLVLAIATPAAQAAAQAIMDAPVLFTSVTDPVAADLVDSLEQPGGNVTGTSDLASIPEQFDLLAQLVPDAETVGIVYSSGEVNSEVQVDAAKEAAQGHGIEIAEQTVTTANDIGQAVSALGDVDAIYVPTDNMVVSGIGSLVQSAESAGIPVIGAEAGTVEGGAAATLGIDYHELGKQTGEMALRILEEDADPAETPVETASKTTYVVNEAAAEAQGVEIPAEILDQAEKVG